jgi:hypothetical protein
MNNCQFGYITKLPNTKNKIKIKTPLVLWLTLAIESKQAMSCMSKANEVMKKRVG